MNNQAIVGKTYSLYGLNGDTEEYYARMREVADLCLREAASLPDLLAVVRKASRSKRRLRRTSSSSFLLHTLRREFSHLTVQVATHLKNLSLKESWDRTLATSEEQYHLYMLEIELTNRLSAETFRGCETKLAFLPHCLRDLTADCRSTKRGADYVCKGCSSGCTVNAVSKLLRRHGVSPYIWMTANLRPLLRTLKKDGKAPGVLGVACIPELVHGMRLCGRLGVPAVGIPLDANRCARWWGQFHPNTVNLRQIEKLLGNETRRKPGHRVGAPS